MVFLWHSLSLLIAITHGHLRRTPVFLDGTNSPSPDSETNNQEATATSLTQGQSEHRSMASCVEDYASKLDAIQASLGGAVRDRFGTVDFNSNQNHKGIILCAGFGTTGTRSLTSGLRLMNLTGEHWEEGSYVNKLYGKLGPWSNLPEGDPNCKETLRNLFPSSFRYDKEFLADSPAGELFLDFLWTFPDSKVILTSRPPEEWARKRMMNHPGVIAPLEEPCGFRIEKFSVAENAAMFAAHNDLVRCVVPKERLFEINPWEDSQEKMRDLMKNLASFLGTGGNFSGVPFPVRKTSTKPRMVRLAAHTSNFTKIDCASQGDILAAFQRLRFPANHTLQSNKESPFLADIFLSTSNGRTLIGPEDFGILMKVASDNECEIDLASDDEAARLFNVSSNVSS